MSNEEVVMDVGYIRCSTAKQELEVQRQKMRDAGVDAVYEDFAESGAKLGREGLEKALAAVREGDRLTVVKVDRLSRSLRDLLELVGDLRSVESHSVLLIRDSTLRPLRASSCCRFSGLWPNLSVGSSGLELRMESSLPDPRVAIRAVSQGSLRGSRRLSWLSTSPVSTRSLS